MQSNIHFLELTPKSWDAAKLISSQLGNYCFRGQSDNNWNLTTTIERLAHPTMVGDRERHILKTFKSRAYQYIQSPPTDQDNIEWLSIIQDYGGPTRLLDFTYSFYIAAFFAFEPAVDDACIWAISDLDLWEEASETKYPFIKRNEIYSIYQTDQYNNFAEEVIVDQTKSIDFVIKITPARLNERLAVQKGLFLFNCNVDKGFENSLCKTFNLPFDKLDHKNATKLSTSAFLKLPKPFLNDVYAPVGDSQHKQNEGNENKSKQHTQIKHVSLAPIIKIRLSKKYRLQALHDLESMNINYASLFPGLEGFAKYMRMHVYVQKGDMQIKIMPGSAESTSNVSIPPHPKNEAEQ